MKLQILLTYILLSNCFFSLSPVFSETDVENAVMETGREVEEILIMKVGSSTSTSAMVGLDSTEQSEARGNNTGSSSDTVQESTNPASPAPDAFLLPEVVVSGRADSLLGIAEAASQGTVGMEELEYRTLSRPGEVLETVPGVIVTQHSGAGKAN